MSRRRGFSLIELMLVVVVIGLLAAIAIPNFMIQQRKAKLSQRAMQIRLIEDSGKRYFRNNDRWPIGDSSDSTLLATWNPATLATNGMGDFAANNTEWRGLETPIDGRTRFQYQLTGEHSKGGVGNQSWHGNGKGKGNMTPATVTFTLTVRQDLDGDGVYAVTSRTSTLNGDTWVTEEVLSGDVEY